MKRLSSTEIHACLCAAILAGRELVRSCAGARWTRAPIDFAEPQPYP
jgi:hypothetical protein